MAGRVGGTCHVLVDGVQQSAKGEFTYNLGAPKREPVIGEDGVHGYSEQHQVSRIEGEITDNESLDLEGLVNMNGVTVTLELANGKTITQPNSWYAGDGDVRTREGNVQFLFHGAGATET